MKRIAPLTVMMFITLLCGCGNEAEIRGRLSLSPGIVPCEKESGAVSGAGIGGDGFYKYSIDETEILVYYDTENGSITGLTAKERGMRYDFTVVTAADNEEQSYGNSRS